MSQIYLEIGTMEDLIEFIQEAKEVGLLKDISCDKVKTILKDKQFPVRLPVDLDKVFNAMSNPIIRKVFGKKIEDTTEKTILKVANE